MKVIWFFCKEAGRHSTYADDVGAKSWPFYLTVVGLKESVSKYFGRKRVE
jgi:hypothetical protein